VGKSHGRTPFNLEKYMQLFNIYYIDDTYGDPPLYLITTNNPAQWIKEHNQKRKVEGSDPEILEYMSIKECELKIFENSNFKMLTGKEKPFKWTDR
jgi:hypothetical protein